jgi:hypothetical protein
VDEALAEAQERVSAGVELEEAGREVIDRAADAAGEAVPAVVIELQAGGAVVVKSGSAWGVYAREVKGRLKPRFPRLPTGYPEGTGNGG